MNRVGRLFALSLLPFVAGFAAHATDKCGAVCGEVWTPGGSPYVVTCDVTVAAACQLTIQAGVEVRFQADTDLLVDGNLQILGTLASPVELRSDEASPAIEDWGAIVLRAAGSSTIEQATIRHATYGVHATGTATVALDEVTIERCQRGIYVQNEPTLTLTDVTSRLNVYGLYASTQQSASISGSGGSFTDNTLYGLYVLASYAAGPTLDIDGPEIHSNAGGYDVRVQSFGNPTERVLRLRNAWWGTADPAQIVARVYDQLDSTSAPMVDWCRYLDGPGGSPVVDAHCPDLAVCDETTSWSLTDKPYQVTSELVVCPTGTLQILPDVTARFVPDPGLNLRIDGRLEVNLAEGDAVGFRSDRAAPQPSDWGGVRVQGSGDATIRRATIEHGLSGVHATGSAQVALDTVTLERGAQGIYVQGESTLTLDDVTSRLNNYGLQASTQLPASITGSGASFVENTTYGLYLLASYGGGATLDIDGASIHSNAGPYDVRAQSFGNPTERSLLLRNAWWGTSDPAQIAARVYDQLDSTSAPMVDWCRYLDGPGGSPVVDAHCPDLSICDETALWDLTDKPYQVTSELVVCPTGTLQVGPGVEVRLVPSSSLNARIDGELQVNLAGGATARFRSDRAAPVASDWGGVDVRSNGQATIREATIQHGNSGVRAAGTAQVALDRVTLELGESGIRVEDQATLVLDDVTARLNSYGLYASTQQPASITGSSGSFVNNTTHGIYVVASYGAGPLLDIDGPEIHSNGSAYDVRLQSFGNPTERSLLLRNAWWGSADPAQIVARVYDQLDSGSSPMLDWCRYLDGPGGSPVVDAHCPDLAVCGETAVWNLTDKPYQITSELAVCPTGTLQVLPDVTARFVPATPLNLRVQGALEVNLVEGDQVLFTSDRAVPQPSDWGGVAVQLDGEATVRQAVIEYGKSALHARNDAQVELDGVTLEHGDHGVLVQEQPTVTLTDVTSRLNNYGIYANTQQPAAIGGSGGRFTENSVSGVYLLASYGAGPTLDIDGAEVHSNTGPDDVHLQSFGNPTERSLLLRNAWWGTTDPEQIVGRVFDQLDSTTAPMLDWCGYLDGPGGAPVVDAHCPDLAVCDESVVWDLTDKPYQVTSELVVCPSGTLDVLADVTARFVPATALNLRVDGQLDVNPTSGDPVRFYSDRPTPQPADWGGVLVRASGDAAIRQATIEHGDSGVHATDSAELLLDGVTIERGTRGIYVEGQPTVTLVDVTSRLNSYGLHAATQQPAVISGSGSRFVDNSSDGLYFVASYSTGPSVSIGGSSIHSNAGYDVRAQSFANAADRLLWFSDNWWGTTDYATIGSHVFDHEDSGTSPHVWFHPFGDDCAVAIGSDRDGDGHCDFEDNCADVPNASQNDLDGDGMGDSCDSQPSVDPSGACDGVDDVLEGYADLDLDGWGDPCDFQPLRDDCYPGAPELCDGRDNDGDGLFLAGELVDGDLDGAMLCGDCDDAEAEVFPCACEICSNVREDDCDGLTDGADPDCFERPYCLTFAAHPTDPGLRVDKQSCGGATTAAPVDVIRGSIAGVAIVSGSVDLGSVVCVQGNLAWDRVTDVAADPNPLCGESLVFFLARNVGASDFGASYPGGELRDTMSPDPVCP